MSDLGLDITAIAERACLEWPCITSAPRLFMHRENSVFKVDTRFGAAALRVHRYGYHARAAIESELQWMAYLEIRGLEIPKPFANRVGTFISNVEMYGKSFQVDLLHWLEGEPLGNSTDPLAFDRVMLQKIFFNLGASMARLHQITDEWSLPAGFQRHAWDRDGFTGQRAFWGKFWEASNISKADRKILVQAKIKAGRKLDSLRESGADYGLIHADFVRQNVLVSGTEIRIIDFDDSGFGFRMYDFATALVKNRSEPHYETIKQSLFDGYRSERRLSTESEQTLGLFLALRDFAYLGWMEARRNEPGVGERMAGIRAETVAAAQNFLET